MATTSIHLKIAGHNAPQKSVTQSGCCVCEPCCGTLGSAPTIIENAFSRRSSGRCRNCPTIPLLTGAEYRAHTPPNGERLSGRTNASGFALASGGTTGAPRSCYRTVEEQH